MESERQHAAMLAEQATWLVERDNVYRRTQAEVLGPRGGSPRLMLKAREAAVEAVLEFERRNPPEKGRVEQLDSFYTAAAGRRR